MRTLILAVLATIVFLSSATVMAEGQEWLNSWVPATAEDYGGWSYVESERFNNSGVGLYSRLEDDCSLSIAGLTLREGAKAREFLTMDTLNMRDGKVLIAQDSVAKVRVDGGYIHEWTKVPTTIVQLDSESYLVSNLLLVGEDTLFVEMLKGTKLILQVDDDQTEEVSLVGFSKAASSAIDFCIDKRQKTASNEWNS